MLNKPDWREELPILQSELVPKAGLSNPISTVFAFQNNKNLNRRKDPETGSG